eukprot:scaffold15599_cov129-Skeletonema_dohrnii-CCMP3373.AAC.12
MLLLIYVKVRRRLCTYVFCIVAIGRATKQHHDAQLGRDENVGIGAFPTTVPAGPNILIWEHCGRGVGEQWVSVGEQWVSPVVHYRQIAAPSADPRMGGYSHRSPINPLLEMAKSPPCWVILIRRFGEALPALTHSHQLALPAVTQPIPQRPPGLGGI